MLDLIKRFSALYFTDILCFCLMGNHFPHNWDQFIRNFCDSTGHIFPSSLILLRELSNVCLHVLEGRQ
jgi:hypothetical protein